MTMLVLTQTAAPIQQRVRAAIEEFDRSISAETFVLSMVAIAIVLAWLYVVRRAYLAWYMRKHGFQDSYLRKRKKFDD